MKKKEFDSQKALGLIMYMRWHGALIHKLNKDSVAWHTSKLCWEFTSRTSAREFFQQSLEEVLAHLSPKKRRILKNNYKWKLTCEILYKGHDEI